MTDHEDELVDAVRELTRTIDALRAELDESGPRRPRLRPPTPRELLRVTDEVAIPAALAVLETSVRALEAFQRGLQVVRTERAVRDRTETAAASTGEQADRLRQTTLSSLDTVLSELQRAASSGQLPADDEARDLLAEARDLRDDVDSRLRAAAETDPEAADRDRSDGAGGVTIDIEEGPLDDGGRDGTDGDPDPAVDVDAELETLRDQYGEGDSSDGDSDASDGTDGSSSDGGDDGSSGGENADGTADGSSDEN
ncbi:hypothetical protein NP511_03285 [Natrinema thermotolerans]|uniref:Uncharacterized protein n=1 Tax=Natrinema thermotolerans TaxID=121872 RepID=A0AAF0PFR6_9EURY|nr:hypothetical protein [Natrinema thermotolerans]QCC57586.1 hypothetical protein DVR14_02580 [Natrinema thermotolerans]WMT08664.1 hypothetical protein NP511_03285 [Natrinema thermotolerans]